MKKRKFSFNRHVVKRTDAQQRWDHAYQYLVQWSAVSPKDYSHGASCQEGTDESRHVCPGLYAAAGASADH